LPLIEAACGEQSGVLGGYVLQKTGPAYKTEVHPRRISVHPGVLPTLVLFGLGLGLGLSRLGSYFPAGRDRAVAIEAYERASHFVREGERIRVPSNSPLRGKLSIKAVAEREIQRTLVLPAVVEADPAHLIKVVPPLTGQVRKLMVQLGERVELGQPLLIFDSPDLGTAYADYDRAKANLALAIKSRDRLRELVQTSAAATKDLQQAETDSVTAEVEKQRAQLRLRQIGVDHEKPSQSGTVTISAPISGSVIDLAIAPGAYWNDPTAALMTVADLSTIWVTANVPEKDISLVAKGHAVDVSFAAYPSEIFKGQVLFVSDVLDGDTRRTKVRIAFHNPGTRLKLNMFANVSFLAPKQMMPVIPTAALVLKNETDEVFIETEPWTFEERAVEIAFEEGDQAVVKSGLKAGDRVVTQGGVLLND
jgi:membrane fusion protein, heavy metal efflux system